jgi:hypothetical protein
MSLRMSTDAVRPGAFRFHAFLEGWILPIEAHLGYSARDWHGSAAGRLNATLVEEGYEWIRVGQEVGYFDAVDVERAHPHLGAEAHDRVAADPSAIDGPEQFGWLLSEAQDDLSEPRRDFLESMLFADARTFRERLAPAETLAEQLLGDPQLRFSDEVVDQIQWLLDGSKSGLDDQPSTPASWRGASLDRHLVANEDYARRWSDVTRVREAIRAALISPDLRPADLS